MATTWTSISAPLQQAISWKGYTKFCLKHVGGCVLIGKFISNIRWEPKLPYRKSRWTHRTLLPHRCLPKERRTLKNVLDRLYISLYPVALTLEHSASVKRFVSLQSLIPKTVGRTPWTGDQPVARPLHRLYAVRYSSSSIFLLQVGTHDICGVRSTSSSPWLYAPVKKSN
jgi:hypothetical protein